MKKNNLFTTIVFIFSAILLIVSSAIFVYSAQLQVTHSTLSVSYVADNVSFTSTAFYQVAGSNSITYFTDSAHPSESELSFVASNLTSYTRTLNASNFNLDVNNNYVLLTFSFRNDATEGGYCIKVSLTDGTTNKNNVNVTYFSESNNYLSNMSSPTSAELTSQKSSVSSATAPTDVYIQAQQTKYFYVLIEVDDLYLNANYTSTGDYGLEWNVQATTYVTEPSPFEFDPNNSSIITGLTDLGKSATTLTIPSTVTTLDDNAFDDVNPNLTSLYIPSTVEYIESTSLQHVQFSAITWQGGTSQKTSLLITGKKFAAGRWPQSAVSEALNDTLNDEYKENNHGNLVATGKSYSVAYNASDNTVELDEYMYQGVEYARMPNDKIKVYNDTESDIYKFTGWESGHNIMYQRDTIGTDIWFKVEPIVVTIVVTIKKNESNQIEVHSDAMLGRHMYDTSVANWYTTNSMATYLNDTFYTQSGLSSISSICNKNATTRTDSTNGDYAVQNTKYGEYAKQTSNDNENNYDTYDHIWLPSYAEMCTLYGGTTGSPNTTDLQNARKLQPSDLCKATNVYMNNSGYGSYYLRSAGGSASTVCDVRYLGYVLYSRTPTDSNFGFRLAFAFNL